MKNCKSTYLAFCFALFACEEKEGVKIVDPRDQLPGHYMGVKIQYDGWGRFLTQWNNAGWLIRKGANPSIIDIVEGGEVLCKAEIEPARGGFILRILPGPVAGLVDGSGSSEGYSIVDHVDGFYDQEGHYVKVINDDSSFYDIKTSHFSLYYTILYNDTPIRFVVLDGVKM